MSKMRLLIVFLSVLVITVFSGCADQSQKTGKFTDEEMAKIPFIDGGPVPAHSGGLVLSMGTETITIKEIVTPVMQVVDPPADTDFDTFILRVRPVVREAVIGKITDVLLYKEAKKAAPENMDQMLEKVIEDKVNKFLSEHDNDYAKAQEALKERGMDWKQYREFQKKLQLTGWYYSSQNVLDNNPISYSEMLEYYNAMQKHDFRFRGQLQRQDVKVDGLIQFRLIDIDGNKLEADDIDIDNLETPKQAALRKAKKLIAMIDGGADFGELAMTHSHGHRAQSDGGGLWTPVTDDSPLIGRWKVLQQQADSMQAGDVAGPIESEKGAFIMKLEKKVAPWQASFQELQEGIKTDIRMARNKKGFDKLIQKLMSQASFSNMDSFINVCTEAAWREWKAEQANG